VFKVEAADRCIELISRNMHKLGAIVKRENPVPTLKEEDVT
jgi:hypothetical protein